MLVIQDHLLDYMKREFDFSGMSQARAGDCLHVHSYQLRTDTKESHDLSLVTRLSTDSAGMKKALGLQVTAKIEISQIIAVLESKISDKTRMEIGPK